MPPNQLPKWVLPPWQADLQSEERTLRPRDNGRLDVAVAVQHVPQDLLQPRERGLAGDVIGALNFPFANQREGFAHRLRRVMEGGLQRDL